jgi:YVTN family beta-propeller protein
MKTRSIGLLLLLACSCKSSSSGAGTQSDAGTSAAPVVASGEAPIPFGGPRLYVSNEAAGAVTVIDAAKRTVLRSIPVGKRPRGIQASPDGKTIFMALSGSAAQGPGAPTGPKPPPDRSADGIGMLDAVTLTLTGKLPSGPDPEQFALTADGTKLYVSNEETSAASIIDVPGKALKTVISVDEEPEGVSMSPDGKWVYVTCEEADSVNVIDTATGAVVSKLKVGKRPRSTGFLPDSSRAYVASEMGSSIAVIGLPKHTLDKTIALEGGAVRPMGVVAAPDGKRVYVSTGHAGLVLVVDTEKNEIAGKIQVGGRPWGIAISKDGKTLYTANGTTDDVSVVDLGEQKEVARIKVGGKPWGVVYVP